MGCSPPGSSVHKGFSRQENWSGEPFPSPEESSRSRDRTRVSCIARRFFSIGATREALMQPNKYINVTKKKKNTKHLGEILPPPLRKQLQGKVTSAKSSMGSLWLGLFPAYAPPLCTPRRPPRHPPSSSPLSLPTLGLTDLQGPAPAQIPWNSGFFLGGGEGTLCHSQDQAVCDG